MTQQIGGPITSSMPEFGSNSMTSMPTLPLKKQGSQQAAGATQQPNKQTKRYVLTVLKENGQYEPLTIEEMNEFERQNPEIAKFWLEPALLESLEQTTAVKADAPVFETWDLAAKRLMAKLCKLNDAWIFREPVDPERMNIPDYD